MLEKKLAWYGHSAFSVTNAEGRIIYFDPFRLPAGAPAADFIFISHEHYDHCSPADIAAIASANTLIAGNAAVAAKLGRSIAVVKPGERGSLGALPYETVPAYNLEIPNHRRELGHVGFIVTVDGERIYHAGDTDLTPELSGLKADIALLPVGGTYTMDAQAAARAARVIEAGIFIPMHYGGPVGSPADGEAFRRACAGKTLLPEKETK